MPAKASFLAANFTAASPDSARLLTATGKPKKLAVLTAMHKLVHTVYSGVSEDLEFDSCWLAGVDWR